MKKIMFITNRLPFPNTDGRKNMLLQYIRQMKEIYPGSELVNLSFVDDAKYLKDRPDEIDRLVCLELPGLAEKLFNIMLYSLLLRKWPLQVSLYYSRKTHRKVKDYQNRAAGIHLIRHGAGSRIFIGRTRPKGAQL